MVKGLWLTWESNLGPFDFELSVLTAKTGACILKQTIPYLRENGVGMRTSSLKYFDCDDFSTPRVYFYMYTYYGEKHFSVVMVISQ